MDFFDKTFKTEDLLLQSLPWHRELVIGTEMLAEEVKEDLEALLQNFLNKYWTNIKALLRQLLNKYSTNIKLSFNKYWTNFEALLQQIFIFCAQCNSTLIDSWMISISLSEKQDGRLCLKSGCQTFFLKNIFSPKTGSHSLVEKRANVGVDISDLVKSHYIFSLEISWQNKRVSKALTNLRMTPFLFVIRKGPWPLPLSSSRCHFSQT